MTWVQYRDADHHLSKLFGINAIPHYFTIDSDGVLTSEMLGSGSDVEGKLKKLIAQAKAGYHLARRQSSGWRLDPSYPGQREPSETCAMNEEQATPSSGTFSPP